METQRSHLDCDIGGAKEPAVIYFPTNWGAKSQGSHGIPSYRTKKKHQTTVPSLHVRFPDSVDIQVEISNVLPSLKLT